MRGAIREDDAPTEGNPKDDPYNFLLARPIHHFYDPAFDRPLTVPGIGALDVRSAADWAIGGLGVFQSSRAEENRRNHFTYYDAREAMYRALTGRDSSGTPLQPVSGGSLQKPTDIRNAYWATTFRALGNVLHLNQDMAQPQHTRNVPHTGIGNYWTTQLFVTGHTSIFEKYIEARVAGDSTYRLNGAPIPSGPLNFGGHSIPTFSKLTDFWSTRDGLGRGLADYSNRGFFSVGSNLGWNDYVSPSNNPASYVKESTTGLLDSSARLNFLRGDVTDNQTSTYRNIRMTTESAFDGFLLSKLPPLYGLNRFNYDDMADLLLPKAVAYSAGLLNYFFRGKIDFVTNPANPGGYLIKNLGPEAMKGKFRLFYDDATDKRHPVRDSGGNEIVWDTEVLVTAPMPGLLGAGESMAVPGFTMPSNPAPKAGSQFVLVFAGDMGEERADPASGVVGAVVGKVFTPYEGALYFAAKNSSGHMVYFKLNREGFSALAPNETNPLIWHSYYAVRSPGWGLKQSVITRAADGSVSHRTIGVINGLATDMSAQSLVLDIETGKMTWKDGIRWTARSTDPAIGAFEFTLYITDQLGYRAVASFIRRYTDETGKVVRTTGALQMPDMNQVDFGFRYSDMRINGVYLSGDGTMFYGRRYMPKPAAMRIVLGAAPTVVAVPLPQSTSSRTDLPTINTTSTTGQCSVTYVPYENAGYTLTRTAQMTHRQIQSGSVTVSEGFGINNFVLDAPVYHHTKSNIRQESRLTSESCNAQAIDWSDGTFRTKVRLKNQQQGEEIYVEQTQTVFKDGTFTHYRGGPVIRPVSVRFSCGVPEGGMYTSFLPSHYIRFADLNIDYDGFCPASNMQASAYFSPTPEDVQGFPRRTARRVLTDSIADAIYEDEEYKPELVRVVRFRDTVLPENYFVETSPLGEILIIHNTGPNGIEHHPLPGGMPKLRWDMFPPDIVGVYGIIWM
jgi:hypothetical protein